MMGTSLAKLSHKADQKTQSEENPVGTTVKGHLSRF